MTYEGPIFYQEEDFSGHTKHDVLEGEVEALMNNMDAAGLSPEQVLYAVNQAVNECKKDK